MPITRKNDRIEITSGEMRTVVAIDHIEEVLPGLHEHMLDRYRDLEAALKLQLEFHEWLGRYYKDDEELQEMGAEYYGYIQVALDPRRCKDAMPDLKALVQSLSEIKAGKDVPIAVVIQEISEAKHTSGPSNLEPNTKGNK